MKCIFYLYSVLLFLFISCKEKGAEVKPELDKKVIMGKWEFTSSRNLYLDDKNAVLLEITHSSNPYIVEIEITENTFTYNLKNYLPDSFPYTLSSANGKNYINLTLKNNSIASREINIHDNFLDIIYSVDGTTHPYTDVNGVAQTARYHISTDTFRKQ